MSRFRIALSVLLVIFISQLAFAGDGAAKLSDHLKKYTNDMRAEVKAADMPAEKRRIMNESLQDLNTALQRVEKMPAVSQEDREGINRLQKMVGDQLDELNGKNGMQAVQDNELNDYANYIQQNLEQADKYVTISITTVLLVVIILLLI
ncbi:MAG: hypothetical protein WAN36_12785 [Calditrichia bacterium]